MKYYLIKAEEPKETRTLLHPDNLNKTTYHFDSERVVELTEEELKALQLALCDDCDNAECAIKVDNNWVEGQPIFDKIRKVLE